MMGMGLPSRYTRMITAGSNLLLRPKSPVTIQIRVVAPAPGSSKITPSPFSFRR